MEKDSIIFRLVAKNSVYAFLKDKYPNYKLNDSEDENNIKKIYDYLSDLDRYAHIPDQNIIIKEEYEKIKSFMINESFRESKILESTMEKSKNLTEKEKKDIIDSVVHVMHMDDNISKDEKKIIIQITKFLGVNDNPENIVKDYKKDTVAKSSFPIKTFIFGLIIMVGIAGGLFLKYKQHIELNGYFEKDKLVFSEVYFNKYIIYRNKFSDQSSHFVKFAVYYLSGTADISIDMDKCRYESLTKTLFISYKKPKLFNIGLNLKDEMEVDKLNPKPITEQEAKTMGAMVGIAGAYIGGTGGVSLGGTIGKFLPPQYSFVSTAVGGVLGGVAGGTAGYFVTKKSLTGLSLSGGITEKEKAEVINTAKELIKAQLLSEPNLVKRYKNNFEEFIKLEFEKKGKKISSIKYIGGVI